MRTERTGAPAAAHSNGHLGADWDEMPEWITTTEAAELSGYDVQYIRQLAREGRIGAERKGRDWWVDRDRLREYVNEMAALGTKKNDPRGTRRATEPPA